MALHKVEAHASQRMPTSHFLVSHVEAIAGSSRSTLGGITQGSLIIRMPVSGSGKESACIIDHHPNRLPSHWGLQRCALEWRLRGATVFRSSLGRCSASKCEVAYSHHTAIDAKPDAKPDVTLQAYHVEPTLLWTLVDPTIGLEKSHLVLFPLLNDGS